MSDHLARRYCIFALGVTVISIGIGIITKGSLGTSPITSIPYSLSLVFPQLTLGNFTILFSILLIALQGLLQRGRMDRTMRINLLLEVVVAFLFGYLVDVAMWLCSGLNPTAYWEQILMVFAGIPILAFGVYLQIVANVVMVPGDGFAYALTMRLKRSYGKVRVASDTTMVIIAAIIGIVGLGTLGGVREGTVICCILTGLVARQYMRHLSGLTSLLVPGKDLDTVAEGDRENAVGQ